MGFCQNLTAFGCVHWLIFRSFLSEIVRFLTLFVTASYPPCLLPLLSLALAAMPFLSWSAPVLAVSSWIDPILPIFQPLRMGPFLSLCLCWSILFNLGSLLLGLHVVTRLLPFLSHAFLRLLQKLPCSGSLSFSNILRDSLYCPISP